MWRAFSRTCGPSTARRWWPRAARPCSVRCCPATGGLTNRYLYRSRWSCWTKFPTARSSSCRPATTRIRRPTCETTGPCQLPASPSSTTSDSSAAVEEVRLQQFNTYHWGCTVWAFEPLFEGQNKGKSCWLVCNPTTSPLITIYNDILHPYELCCFVVRDGFQEFRKNTLGTYL